MLGHLANSLQWNMINGKFFEFECDAKNLWLGHSTDGMNPHDKMSRTHNTWLVVLTIYNFPPWLCMKRKFLLISLLFSGPRQLENDTNNYLTPIIEGIKIMWEEEIEVYDAYVKNFSQFML